jgi:hypothetical protein
MAGIMDLDTSLRRLRRCLRRAAWIALSLAGCSACSTLQAPARIPAFPVQETLRVSHDGLEVAARPILGEEAYFELFDDYLPEIGIVAVWVEVRAAGADALEIGPESWQFSSGDAALVALDLRRMFDRYYKRRSVRMVSLHIDAEGLAKMERVAFRSGRVAGGRPHSGFLFFDLGAPAARAWNQGAPQNRCGLRLRPNANTTVEIVFPHEHP